MSEGGVVYDAAVLRADVDEEEVAGTEAVSPLVGAPVPRDPVADVHRFSLGAYSSCTCAERDMSFNLWLRAQVCGARTSQKRILVSHRVSHVVVDLG